MLDELIGLKIVDLEYDENDNIERIELSDGTYLVPSVSFDMIPTIIIE